ncbi:cytochrome P450 [Sphingobium sp. R-7]|uniref:cytochrome P450 n=1 Tax=Sphingobium sp. R-7 TaxID=3375449 RepID=UPI00398A9786
MDHVTDRPRDFAEIDDQLTTPSFFAGDSFHAAFRLLRAEDPVHWTKGNHERGFWSVTRYDDCVKVLQDAAVFSSSEGSHLPPSATPLTDEERFKQGYGAMPTHTDPPRHMKMRQPFNKHFYPKAIDQFRDKCEKAVETIMADVGPRGECEAVEDIAALLPVALVLEMMGIPRADWPMVRHQCVTFMSSQDPTYQIDGDPVKTKVGAQRQVFEYMLQLAMERRRHPSNDFTSLIGTMLIDGEPMSERDVGWWCFSLTAAGLETTRNAAALGLLELMRRPEAAEQWRTNKALSASAVEEILRFTTPSKHKLRVAMEDTELAGKSIRKGDWLVVWLASANRDEAVFDRPDELDLTRDPNRHLTFGIGEHLCLGRNLARLELQSLLPRVLELMPDVRLAEPADYLASDNTNGLKSLRIQYTPFTL